MAREGIVETYKNWKRNITRVILHFQLDTKRQGGVSTYIAVVGPLGLEPRTNGL